MKLTAILTICLALSGGAQVKQWCAEGQKCIDEGDGMGAACCYKKCCDFLGTGRKIIPLVSSLQNIAKIYVAAGDFQEAEKYIQRSIGLGKILGRTGSLALRYQDASCIHAALGNKEEALCYAREGLEIAFNSNNENTIGQLLMQVGDCYGALGEYRKSDSLYREAVGWLYKQGKGRLFVPQAYLKLGDNAKKSGDMKAARAYYEQMLEKTNCGYDQLQMYTACNMLSELLAADDPPAAAQYRQMADSLDFAPMVEEFGANLALCNLEFPRREREQQIEAGEQRIRLVSYIAILLFLLICLAAALVIILKRNLKRVEIRNAGLIKANLQKDALLSIASSAARELEEIKRISKDEIPLPRVKLTKRELQIARLACEGKINKEIADVLGISTGTVAVHKNNLFRKLGVGNTVELLRYLQKIGL